MSYSLLLMSSVCVCVFNRCSTCPEHDNGSVLVAAARSVCCLRMATAADFVCTGLSRTVKLLKVQYICHRELELYGWVTQVYSEFYVPVATSVPQMRKRLEWLDYVVWFSVFVMLSHLSCLLYVEMLLPLAHLECHFPEEQRVWRD